MSIHEINLTYNYLDDKYGQDTIFQFLFPDKIAPKKQYRNPLRNDKSEGCVFIYMGNTFTFKDLSKNINYSWRDFGMAFLNLSYYDLLRYVNTGMKSFICDPSLKSSYDINSLTSSNSKSSYSGNTTTDIDIKSRPFKEKELFKFKDYVCTEEILQKANIYCIKNVYINGQCSYQNCNNSYAFLNIDEFGKKNYQLYFPLKEKFKRYRSITTKLIPQLENIDLDSKYVIITKSNMDAFILKHVLGFNAIAILNEGVMLSQDFINRLSKHDIYLLFDNDVAGRNAVIKYIKTYSNINFNVLFVPFKYGKDIKDLVSNYNIDTVRKVINSKLFSI